MFGYIAQFILLAALSLPLAAQQSCPTGYVACGETAKLCCPG